MVPQFIDVEDKIIGPITVRQFVLIVVGGVILFLAFRFADLVLFILIAVVIIVFVFLFGFLKINGMAFHLFLLNLIAGFKKPNLRIWKREYDENRGFVTKVEKKSDQKIKEKEKISNSRLAELSLIVDTKGEYKGE